MIVYYSFYNILIRGPYFMSTILNDKIVIFYYLYIFLTLPPVSFHGQQDLVGGHPI